MELVGTEKLKLQYVSIVRTATSIIIKSQESTKELAEKITRILGVHKKISKFIPSFKKCCSNCHR